MFFSSSQRPLLSRSPSSQQTAPQVFRTTERGAASVSLDTCPFLFSKCSSFCSYFSLLKRVLFSHLSFLFTRNSITIPNRIIPFPFLKQPILLNPQLRPPPFCFKSSFLLGTSLLYGNYFLSYYYTWFYFF